MRRFLPVLPLVAFLAACGDDDVREKVKTCAEDPTLPECPPPPNCRPGTLVGRICAPDQRTFVAGAEVFSTGECDGKAFSAHAVADAEGRFRISMPQGTRRVLAVSGSFQRAYEAEVTADTITEIPDDQLCFERDTARIAVINAFGDQIGSLLENLGLEYTAYEGDGDKFDDPGQARDLLTSSELLAQYDVLMINCGAARVRGQIDLGDDTELIARNLRQFVESGGSLYASDWAFFFVHVAFDEIRWKTRSGDVPVPFPTDQLMGYGPQKIDAVVVDPKLEERLGKGIVPINYPWETGARSRNWGLIQTVAPSAHILIAGEAQLCADARCDQSRGTLPAAPLAVLLDYAEGPGGAVIYTSFHNIAQDTTDVGEILKYLIFKL